MPLLSIDYINQCFLLDFMLKIDKKKLPLHESHFVKATAPFLLYKCPFVQSECLIASYLSITSTVVPIYEIKRQDARKSIQ